MTAERASCQTCGTALPPGAPEGLCPKCLLQAAFPPLPQDQGLHLHCPHCHNPIELIDAETALSEVQCPSCGSSVSVLGDDDPTCASELPTSLGRFRLLERVGIGAFGAVWKAHDPQLDRTVAVKIPRKDQLLPAEVEQFLREARSAAQLKHPNIVRVHEVGRAGETVFLVSDFIEGVTLADWLSAKCPTDREAAEMCVKIGEALQHAHDAGVVHRDLKPSNIMLGVDGTPHVMDFGLAKRDAGEITMTLDGKVLGTPAYMSPEQAQGKAHSADGRTDIYSLGVILFELLTGQRPFRGNPQMLIHQVIHDEPPRPRQLDKLIPRDLETICLKCLRKSPAERYQTAGDLVCDLEAYLQHRPISARPIGWPARMIRTFRRRPAVTGLAFVSLVLICSIGVVHLSNVSEKQHLRAEARGERKRGENYRLNNLLSLAKTVDYDVAVQDAELVMADEDPTYQRVYAVASVYALASGSAAADQSLDEMVRAQKVDHYRAQALRLLTRLADSGYFASPDMFHYLQTDPDLDVLRDEPEFLAMLGQSNAAEVPR